MRNHNSTITAMASERHCILSEPLSWRAVTYRATQQCEILEHDSRGWRRGHAVVTREAGRQVTYSGLLCVCHSSETKRRAFSAPSTCGRRATRTRCQKGSRTVDPCFQYLFFKMKGHTYTTLRTSTPTSFPGTSFFFLGRSVLTTVVLPSAHNRLMYDTNPQFG